MAPPRFPTLQALVIHQYHINIIVAMKGTKKSLEIQLEC